MRAGISLQRGCLACELEAWVAGLTSLAGLSPGLRFIEV